MFREIFSVQPDMYTAKIRQSKTEQAAFDIRPTERLQRKETAMVIPQNSSRLKKR